MTSRRVRTILVFHRSRNQDLNLWVLSNGGFVKTAGEKWQSGSILWQNSSKWMASLLSQFTATIIESLASFVSVSISITLRRRKKPRKLEMKSQMNFKWKRIFFMKTNKNLFSTLWSICNKEIFAIWISCKAGHQFVAVIRTKTFKSVATSSEYLRIRGRKSLQRTNALQPPRK